MLDKLLIFAFKVWLGFVTGQLFVDMVVGGSLGARIQFLLRIDKKLMRLALGGMLGIRINNRHLGLCPLAV